MQKERRKIAVLVAQLDVLCTHPLYPSAGPPSDLCATFESGSALGQVMMQGATAKADRADIAYEFWTRDCRHLFNLPIWLSAMRNSEVAASSDRAGAATTRTLISENNGIQIRLYLAPDRTLTDLSAMTVRPANSKLPDESDSQI